MYTRFPFDCDSSPSVLDLSFPNCYLAPYVLSWSSDLPSTSSDHVPFTILLASPLLKLPPLSPDWGRSDWTKITQVLRPLSFPLPPPLPTAHSLAQWFERHIGSLTAVSINNTPLKRPSLHSKPWWSPALAHLHQSYHCHNRSHRCSPTSSFSADYKAAKNWYFKANKMAKADPWNALLAGVDPSSVWTAKRLAY